MLLTEADARAITARLLGYVKADDAVVFLQIEDYSHLRFAANTFLTSGKRERTTARVTVWIDKRRGSASTTDLSDAALKQAVEDAETFAKRSEERRVGKECRFGGSRGCWRQEDECAEV